MLFFNFKRRRCEIFQYVGANHRVGFHSRMIDVICWSLTRAGLELDWSCQVAHLPAFSRDNVRSSCQLALCRRQHSHRTTMAIVAASKFTDSQPQTGSTVATPDARQAGKNNRPDTNITYQLIKSVWQRTSNLWPTRNWTHFSYLVHRHQRKEIRENRAVSSDENHHAR